MYDMAMKMNSKAERKSWDVYIAFDVFLSILLILFFIGYLNIHAEEIGLQGSPLPFSKQVEEFWNVLEWIVFGGIALDVYVKYRKVGEPRIFLRKHWLDLLMLVLWPVFVGLKLAKISVKLVKGLKITKSGYKALKAAKKLTWKKKHKD